MKNTKIYTKVFNNRVLAHKYYNKVQKNEAVSFCWCQYSVAIHAWEVGWEYR